MRAGPVCAGRQTVNVQCRPCGLEWQPCCANLQGLCGAGFQCYSEQDRCVVAEYVGIKENFFPTGALDALLVWCEDVPGIDAPGLHSDTALSAHRAARDDLQHPADQHHANELSAWWASGNMEANAYQSLPCAAPGAGPADAIAASGPICGGFGDPPCMEASVDGPEWSCDDGVVLSVPGVHLQSTSASHASS